MATRRRNARALGLRPSISRGIKGLMVSLACAALLGCGPPSMGDSTMEIRGHGEPKPNYQNAAKIYTQLGLAYLSQGQVVRAKDKLTSAMRYAPKDAEVASAWGIYWEQVGDVTESRLFHEKAMRLSKPAQISTVFDAYGSFLCRQGDWPAAQQAFQRALLNRQSLNLPFIYENAGLCAAKMQHFEEAEEYLGRALQMDAQRSAAALTLSQLKIQQGLFVEAENWLHHYEKYGAQTAQSVLMALQIARGLNQIDRIEQLELLFKRSFHRSPEYQAYRKSMRVGKSPVGIH